MKITLIAHKYSLKVKMLYITRHCLIFFCIQGLIRVLIYVTLSPKQTLFQWALFKGLSAIQCERWTTFHNTRSLFLFGLTVSLGSVPAFNGKLSGIHLLL